jgi:hypothetical protein
MPEVTAHNIIAACQEQELARLQGTKAFTYHRANPELVVVPSEIQIPLESADSRKSGGISGNEKR